MKTENVVLTKIEADEGMYLTNGETYGKIIYLGKNDATENWHEITETEYEQIINQRESEVDYGDTSG